MASLDERGVVAGVAFVNPHSLIPFIGDAREVRVERGSKAAEQVRQRIFEVPVPALAEAVPRHVDVTSKVGLIGIEGRNGAGIPLPREASAIRRSRRCRVRVRGPPSHRWRTLRVIAEGVLDERALILSPLC